jgi:hypothetical protein
MDINFGAFELNHGTIQILIVKISKDNHFIVQTRLNIDLYCDLHTLLTMSCVLPLFEAINALIKSIQRRRVFICDFVVVVQIWQVDFFMMWFDPMINY